MSNLSIDPRTSVSLTESQQLGPKPKVDEPVETPEVEQPQGNFGVDDGSFSASPST